MKGKASIDWLQLACRIVWNDETSEFWFSKLRQAKEVAQEHRRHASITIGSDIVSVTSSGSGGGRDSYKEFQLIWNGVKVALSDKTSRTRQESNGSLQASGSPCLVTGAGNIWEFFFRLVQNLGGTVVDEWIRRLDICVDLPGLDYSTSLYPMLLNRQVVTRCRNSQFSVVGEHGTGYSVGKSSRLRVSIYDKLHETLNKCDPVYLSAMMQRRWGGMPEHATRVEWQMGRTYLQQFGIDTATECFKRMPDVFAKLTDESGGAFRLTVERPDKGNNHQTRAQTHPIWKRVVEIGRRKIGESTEPLTRLDRSRLDEHRAIIQIIGYATSIADRRQTICETKADVLRVIEETMNDQQTEDADILDRFMRKAKASGTWQDIFSFPGKRVA